MSIILPDFKDRKCLDAQFCGFISAADIAQQELPPPVEEPLIAEYEQSGQKILTRLVPSFPLDEDGDLHLHLDFVPVREQKLRRPNAQIDEITSRLDRLILGQKISVRSSGTFRIPVTELPSFIRPVLEESSVGGIQVRMTAGTLSLRGASVQSVSWRLVDKETVAEIMLEVRTKGDLSESYLIDELNKLESAFKAFAHPGSWTSLREKQNG